MQPFRMSSTINKRLGRISKCATKEGWEFLLSVILTGPWRLLVGFAILASIEWVGARAKSEARNLNLSEPHKGNQP
jgi:hypothetical protein